MSKRALFVAWARMFGTAVWMTIVGWCVGAALGFLWLGIATAWHGAK